jgi:endo-1,4-beta-D-glucanase Y
MAIAGRGGGGVGGGNGGNGGNGSGGTGSGGVPVTPPALGACTLPTGTSSGDIDAAYAKFKTDLLTADGAGGFLRVKRPNSGEPVNSTNSEGIAYGMTIAVYMNDRDTFDQLWKYEQLHRGANGLMDWEINPAGTAASGPGAATDGDEDMAFALVMADKKWGGSGSLSDSYLNHAKKQIDLIWQFEVDHSRADVLTPGDQFGGGQVINISYFAPAYYRIFGKVTGKTAEWNRVVDASYAALSAALNATNKNVDNGLVPAWSTPAGVPTVPAGTSHPINHQLDSSRTPFRIAQDYCWFNEPRALTYLQKISGFYSTVTVEKIVDAYNLDGTPASGASLHLAAFVGPAGVGAMATSAYSTLRNQAYAAIATPPGLLGGSLYYNESWTVLSLLMMNGRFVDLTR